LSKITGVGFNEDMNGVTCREGYTRSLVDLANLGHMMTHFMCDYLIKHRTSSVRVRKYRYTFYQSV